MIEISILKNDIVIKTFKCNKSMLDKTFNKVHNIAGGMWNGKDEFKVIIGKL